MSIKEKRMQRCKELFGQFVSVQSLIDYLAAAESLCIDEVAAELEIAFVRNQANINRPAYGYVDEPSISFVPYSDQKAIDHLSGIFSDAIAFCDHGDASDHHGWLRDELFAFLQENGIDVPDNLPVWVSAAQPPQLIANGGGAISIEKPLGFNGYSYSTPLLELQKAAIFEFYSHPRSVDPKKDEVVSWLFEAAKEFDLALSNNVADAMFTIIKPKDHNPKNRRG